MSDTPSPPQNSADFAGPAPLLPPRVPDHELFRRIGRGAYGEVWLARSVTGAFRAVKIVHRQSFDHDRPFEREFEGILKFEPISRLHDSQVDILHVGRGDDCFYYVMELADDQATGGQINPDHYTPRTLKSDLVFQGRLPFEECVRIGLALATALEHLHTAGLVHRDVKPSNIIFVNGVPKLADIGLVTGVDATRSYVGTEGFAAPEGPGTAQGDIFSLGKVLYELATGKDRQEFPDLPTQLRELPDREGLMELNAVIAKACRHDPKDRYATAAEMRADLELLQSGKSLARLHRMEKQLRLLRRTGVGMAFVAMLILAGWLYQARQTRIVRDLANANARLAHEKSKLAEEKTKLAEENRERLVRLSIANGVRLLDEGDESGSLLWFAQALPLMTNNPAEEEIHRIRIQQVLDRTPRLLNIMAVGDESVTASAFSPDGTLAATAAYSGRLQVWNVQSGEVLWGPRRLNAPVIVFLRFTGDGRRLLVSSTKNSSTGIVSLMAVLDAQTGQDLLPALQQIPGIASNSVYSAFSPDDRWLAVALSNHVIRVLDTRDGRLVVELPGHTNLVEGFTFSADGTILASSSADRTVRLWRLPSGEPQGAPFAFERTPWEFTLSDDGRRLLTATRNGTKQEMILQMWDAQTGDQVGDGWTETNSVRVLTFCPGTTDRFIFADHGADRHEADIRDSSTMKPIFPSVKMAAYARCWTFSPDRKNIAIGNDDGSAYVWSLETGEQLYPRFRSAGWVESVQFSPDGSRLLTTSDDGTAKIWSLRQHAEAARLSLSANFLGGPTQKHGRHGRAAGPISVALDDKAVHLIDPERLTELDILPAQNTNATWAYAAGHSGRCWAVIEHLGGATPSDTVTLWLFERQRWRRLALSHPTNVLHLAFNADDSRLFTFCRDWNVRVWRTSDGGLDRQIAVLKSLWYWDLSVVPSAFRPDCGALLLGHGPKDDEHLQLFDLATGELSGKPFAVANHSSPVNRMRFSPDGTRLAYVGHQSGTVIDFQTRELASPHFKHGGTLFDLDWSPDGTRLITTGLAPEIKLWDAATGKMLMSPMFLRGSIGSSRWSADGRFIAGRSDKRFVRVWDAATTEAVTPLLPHSGYIQWVCITPGNRLITACDPNLLRSWDLKPTTLAPDVIVDYARLLAGRSLGTGGTLLPIKAVELKQLHSSLRSRAPQLFERD